MWRLTHAKSPLEAARSARNMLRKAMFYLFSLLNDSFTEEANTGVHKGPQ